MSDKMAQFLDFDFDSEEEVYQSQKETSTESVYWKAQDGTNLLRIVPPPVAWSEWFAEQGKKPDPFFVLWKHFFTNPNDPDSYYIAPCPARMNGGKCPACEEAKRLGASRDSRDQAMSDEMRPSHRFVVNVVDRSNERGGVKIYEGSYPFRKFQGKSAYEKIRGLMSGVTRVNLVTPGDKGFDLVITKSGAGREGTSYDFGADPRGARPLHDDPAKVSEWINTQPDLREYVTPPSYEDLAALLHGAGERPPSPSNAGAIGGGQDVANPYGGADSDDEDDLAF